MTVHLPGAIARMRSTESHISQDHSEYGGAKFGVTMARTTGLEFLTGVVGLEKFSYGRLGSISAHRPAVAELVTSR